MIRILFYSLVTFDSPIIRNERLVNVENDK